MIQGMNHNLVSVRSTGAQNGFSGLYVNLRPYGGPPGLARFTSAGATVISVAAVGDSAFLRLPAMPQP